MKNKPDILAQAKLVFTTGKMIRDRIFKTQMAGLKTAGGENAFKDLSMAQFHAMMLIQSRGSVSIKELAGCLYVSSPSASVMVERLVEKGLVKRSRSSEDRRRLEISLSDKAALKMKEMEEETFASFVDLVEKLGPESTEKWCEVLLKIQKICNYPDSTQ